METINPPTQAFPDPPHPHSPPSEVTSSEPPNGRMPLPTTNQVNNQKCSRCMRCMRPAEPERKMCTHHRILSLINSRRRCQRRREEAKQRLARVSTPPADLPTEPEVPNIFDSKCARVRCRHPPLPGSNYCSTFCEMCPGPKPNIKAGRQALGLCIDCGNATKPGRKRCPEHLAHMSMRTRKRRNLKKSAEGQDGNDPIGATNTSTVISASTAADSSTAIDAPVVPNAPVVTNAFVAINTPAATATAGEQRTTTPAAPLPQQRLCHRCTKVAKPGMKSCSTCLERRARYMQRHIALGICIDCTRPARPGQQVCAEHHAARAMSRAQYRARLQKAAANSGATDNDAAAATAEEGQGETATATATTAAPTTPPAQVCRGSCLDSTPKYRQRCVAMGLCPTCGKPAAPGRRHCALHMEKRELWEQRRHCLDEEAKLQGTAGNPAAAAAAASTDAMVIDATDADATNTNATGPGAATAAAWEQQSKQQQQQQQSVDPVHAYTDAATVSTSGAPTTRPGFTNEESDGPQMATAAMALLALFHAQ